MTASVIIKQLFNTVSPYILPAGYTLKILKTGTGSNPVKVITNVTLTAIKCSGDVPLPLKLASWCIGLSSIVVATATVPTTFLCSLGLYFIEKVYTICIEVEVV
jgi:hypothetical protein